MEPKIFISYSHADKCEADKVDNFLKENGYLAERDERKLEYKMKTKEFMKSIKNSDFVIALISDSFLRSPNCMYEIKELMEKTTYKARTLQIILNDAVSIFSPEGKRLYLDYWTEKLKNVEIDHTIKYPNSAVERMEKDYLMYKKIQENIYDFMDFLSEEKGIKMLDLEEENYLSLINYISRNHSSNKNINRNLSEIRDLNTFSIGDRLWGKIKMVYNYGFFVQIQSEKGFRDGILHKNKIEAFGYDFSQLKKFFKQGDDVHVEISEINYTTPAAYNTGGLGFSPTYEFHTKLEANIGTYLKKAQKENETFIELRGLRLDKLPKEILGMESLKILILTGNLFNEMPLELDSLPNLETVFCDFIPKRRLHFSAVYYETVKHSQDVRF